jgi:hypothetical protein
MSVKVLEISSLASLAIISFQNIAIFKKKLNVATTCKNTLHLNIYTYLFI